MIVPDPEAMIKRSASAGSVFRIAGSGNAEMSRAWAAAILGDPQLLALFVFTISSAFSLFT